MKIYYTCISTLKSKILSLHRVLKSPEPRDPLWVYTEYILVHPSVPFRHILSMPVRYITLHENYKIGTKQNVIEEILE